MGTFSALALGVVLCFGIGIWRTRHTFVSSASVATPRHPGAVAEAYLEVNASPWATILKIQNTAGSTLDLRSSDRTTPFRLNGVPAGSYEVTLKGADDRVQVTHCEVSAEQHLCMADLGTPDMQQVLKGDRR